MIIDIIFHSGMEEDKLVKDTDILLIFKPIQVKMRGGSVKIEMNSDVRTNYLPSSEFWGIKK